MPLYPIKLIPGINSVKTATLNQGGYSVAQNVRFFNGLPQKDAGFVTFCTVTDIPRSMRAWRALSGLYYLGVAGGHYLSVFSDGVVSDVTPLTISSSVNVSITVTGGSPTITINDTVNNPAVGQAIQIVNPISVGNPVGGIILFGTYIVTAATPSTNYQFVAAQNAPISVTNGGSVRTFTSQIGSSTVIVGLQNHGLVTGQATSVLNTVSVGGLSILGSYTITRLGADQFSIEAGGIATAVTTVHENNGQMGLIFFNPASGGAANAIPAITTTSDNWGEFLMSCSQGGPVNVWMPASGTSTRATVVSTAPLINNFIFVATQIQQLICLGSVNAATGVFDPMLIRWSDIGDYTQFTPAVGNAAGSFRLAIGSQITAGIAMVGQNLIWTDLTLYSMQFLSQPLVWGFQPLGLNCGAVGPHAVGMLAGAPYWMGQNQFFMLGSDGPTMIECPVWDQVFPNLDRANLELVTCETDAFYGEVAWSVPQNNGTFVFVRLRPDPNHGPAWTASTYHHHTAWIDQNVFGAPIGGHEDGLVDQHDTGVNNETEGQIAALPTSLTTGMILISEGSETTFVRDFLPDINWLGTTGTLDVTFYFYSYPESNPRVSGPFAFNPTTKLCHPRGRARAIQIKFEGNDLNSNWRLGNCRYRGHQDGTR